MPRITGKKMQGHKPAGWLTVSACLLVVSVEQTLAFLSAVFSPLCWINENWSLAALNTQGRIDGAVGVLGEHPDGWPAMLF